MKKIGSGWTYNVYDLGEGKVLKKKKKFLERIINIIKKDPREIFSILKTVNRLNLNDKESFSIVTKLRDTDFNFNNIGNPVVLNKYSFNQDLCKPVFIFLEDSKKMQNIIDKYIEQIKYFWQYGFADTVYNFTINNALDNEEELVLIDFNEITDDKELVLETINNTYWTKRFSVKQHLSVNQRKYFLKKMSEEITKENLNKFWRIRLYEKI